MWYAETGNPPESGFLKSTPGGSFMQFSFTKMHGCAMDGILVDAARQALSASAAAANAPWMCERRTGVGADFVALIYPDAKCDARVQVFSRTGRELLACSDAARMTAEYLFRENRVHAGVARIATPGGVLTAVRNAYGVVTMELPAPQTAAEEIPLYGRRGPLLDTLVEAGGEACRVSCVGVGGAHCVQFRSPDGVDLGELGMRCRSSSFFFGGEGLTLAEVCAEKRLRARVWRYGMGEVPVCSECAGAAVTAAVLTDRVRRGADIVVEMPGGELTVRYDGRALFVTGEAVRVFSGEITIGDA